MNCLICAYFNVFFAFASDDAFWSSLAPWIVKFFFIIAVIQFGSGILKWSNHDVSEAMWAFFRAVVLAFIWYFVTKAFQAAGMPTVSISP
jgi:hypothetical protein